MSGRLRQAAWRALDWIAAKTLPAADQPPSTCALAGEARNKLISSFGGAVIASLPAIFALRSIAGNSTWSAGMARFCASSKQERELSRHGKPAEAAVDRAKRRHLVLVARDFMRQMPVSVAFRRARHIL